MGLRFAALRLDRIAARVLHEAGGIGQRAVDRVVALIGHAAQDKRIGRSAPDRLRVHYHHVHGGGDGGRITVRDHRQAVADHRNVDTCGFGPFRRRVVGHRHIDHLFAGLLRFLDVGDGALFALLVGHRWCSRCLLL